MTLTSLEKTREGMTMASGGPEGLTMIYESKKRKYSTAAKGVGVSGILEISAVEIPGLRFGIDFPFPYLELAVEATAA